MEADSYLIAAHTDAEHMSTDLKRVVATQDDDKSLKYPTYGFCNREAFGSGYRCTNEDGLLMTRTPRT